MPSLLDVQLLLLVRFHERIPLLLAYEASHAPALADVLLYLMTRRATGCARSFLVRSPFSCTEISVMAALHHYRDDAPI